MSDNVCPWWVGVFLASPIRKLLHNPENILSLHVKENMKVADIGCALGFFSFPMAKMVGENGEVHCFDVQDSMLKTLKKKIDKKKEVSNNIELHKSKSTDIGLNSCGNDFDFMLAFAVVHEVPNQKKFFNEIYDNLKTGGKLLVAEPLGHVSEENFNKSLKIMKETGFRVDNNITIKGRRSVVGIK